MRAELLLVAVLVGCSAAEQAPPSPPGPLDFDPVALPPGVAMATELRFLPEGSALLFQKDGVVRHLDIAGPAATQRGSFTVPGVFSLTDCGLVSAALDPDFEDNGLLFVGACLDATRSAVLRLRFDPTDYASVADSTVEVLVVGDEGARREWHNVGSIGFDPRGDLWALFGDKTVDANGQDRGTQTGSLLRIRPDRDGAGGYVDVPDNPFAGTPVADPAVFAHGLRSPWRGTLDDRGRWWVGDVGRNDFEEVNVVSSPGENFGWADHEGPCGDDCGGTTPPWVAIPHEGNHAYFDDDPELVADRRRVVFVGPQYRSAQDPYGGALDGAVLFGEICTGFLRGATLDDGGATISDEHVAHLVGTTSMDIGPDGHLYATSFGRCTSTDDDDDAPASTLHRLVRR